jgi:hypothetical protein
LAGKRFFSSFAQYSSLVFPLVYTKLFYGHLHSTFLPVSYCASFLSLHIALLLGSFIALLLGKRRISFAFLMALLSCLSDYGFFLFLMGVFPLHFRKRFSLTFACRFPMVFSQRSFLFWFSQLDIKNDA